MPRLAGRLALCAIVPALLAGCGTASTSEYSWLYVGTDESLKSSPTDRALALRYKLARERGEKPIKPPSVAEYAAMQTDYEIWRRELLATIDQDRATCARKTGDSGKRHFWTGYDPAFLACMSERGWTRPTGSDPL